MFKISSGAAYYLIYQGLKGRYTNEAIQDFIRQVKNSYGAFRIKGTKDAIVFRKSASNQGKGRWCISTEEF